MGEIICILAFVLIKIIMGTSFTKRSIALTTFILLCTVTAIFAQNPEPVEVECSYVWQKSILGYNCPGDKGMYMSDYNNNGLNEIIMAGASTFNVVEYVPAYESYDVIWGSKYYDDLQKMLIADLDNDGNKEIIIIYDRYYLDMYDLLTFELKGTITYMDPYFLELNGTEAIVDDANNDSLNELIVMNYHEVNMYSIDNDTCIKIFSKSEEANKVRCGDVDGDNLNEVVFNNGRVYRMISGQAEFLWTFTYGYSNSLEIEVTDVDNDNLDEIISLDILLEVYDGDTHTEKWPYAVMAYGEALTIADTDGNGLPEILYYDGSTVCIDVLDGSERWSFLNGSYSGAKTLLVGDTDGDDNKEIAAAQCSSYYDDRLSIYQINTLSFEYNNIADGGAYKVMRVADIDNDTRNELITMSSGSESSGPGVISVYDAETKQLEWRDHSLTGPLLGSENYDMEIADVDYDANLEMVVVSSSYNTHVISVIDGLTHHLDASEMWNHSETFDLTIADLDSDGTLELITLSEDSLWILNAQTLQRIRCITHYGPEDFRSAGIGNIDNDSNTELVYLKDSLYVMDGLTGETWSSRCESMLYYCLLYDYDTDGRNDIIVSTNSGIYCIDGITRQHVKISDREFLHEFHMADITGDNAPEFIYTTYSEELSVMHSDGRIEFTPTGAYAFDYLWSEVTDYNNDGKEEIFIGSYYCVQEFDASCFDYCNNLSATVVIKSASCTASNGSAEVLPTGGTQPFSFLWSTGETTATVAGLAAGTYQVTVTDSMLCSCSLDIAIGAFDDFKLDSIATTPDIFNTVECEGNAIISTTSGTPPFEIFINGQWMILEDYTISRLCEGNHQILIRDMNGCVVDTTINIYGVVGLPESDTLLGFNIYPNPATGTTWLKTSLAHKAGTYAKISTLQGVVLKRIEITGQSTQLDASDLLKGIYLITLCYDTGVNTRKLVVE